MLYFIIMYNNNNNKNGIDNKQNKKIRIKIIITILL